MCGGHQTAMDDAEPTGVTERQIAFVARNAGHREDEELGAEQRIDEAQMEE